ncbi:DUF3617 domain-containing protein [Aerolutibacter ruishenii]|uniref:Uncharacterized protein DUF3617 n=1 Tax=Aerolutibacter ruishenii TaxID=686800 RepID=A0A562M448_9GAMM|nr:DUF3617 domain-containing protein [Lysobacter ruishenii]TWI14361.1 uncharacterized protein DUF3617 [Lysobacter ruishenii]
MDTKPVISCVLGVVALFAGHAAAAEATFLPGLYEFKVSYPDEGPEVETSRECLTAAEAKQESLEQQLAETVSDSNCRFTQRTIGGGRFAIAGTCNNGGVRSTLKQSGTYSPTAMAMNMTMSMVPAPGTKPVDVRMVMSSKRIAAACPAGTDKK